MTKQNLLKSATLTITLCCLFLLAACGTATEKDTQTETQTEKQTDTQTEKQTDAETEVKSSETTAVESGTDEIAKISGAADKEGIYAVVITLNDAAAEKGTVEMVYYGAKGSPQENSVVNTFRIEYEKTDGLFDVHTFFDGEVYQNLSKQSKVKVNNTFSATLRAGNVIVSYTPDGGDTREIFRADAEYFRTSD